ncbi:RHS repeat-associated core domain-containing protein [Pedobacter steynii]|uniref:RHS repeat-associated core domain-containing protein n=1 Tax=Pedobacter steynii TaxID=430522 RepID=A0A1G9S344_9SPHI|nr:RHS repeat-associated core domain-containing protein [Pedobacter steynii]NQX37567.1 hypothetical protein [Pedobacter steynii]SDM29687.1 RHS repeat-associated core domain-containing protein [Pedobacter steynii]
MKCIKLLSTTCLSILLLSANAQEVIKSAAPVVLPVQSGGSKIIRAGQSLRVTSNKSVTLLPGFHSESGSDVIIKIETGNIYPVPPNIASANQELNWVISRSFNLNGDTIAESKTFFDLSGVQLQSQSKSFSTKHVLGSQAIYDRFGRAALQTLTAPINSSGFNYKPDFVKNSSGERYNVNNFDTDVKLNNPDPVAAIQEGTLGWYYSNNNSWDNYVPITSYPYSREDYFKDGSGESSRSAGPGELLRMGSGHESYGSSFAVLQQLNNYMSIRNKFFNETDMGGIGQVDMTGVAAESIGRDPQGNWGITISNKDGNPLMTALPGNWLTVNNTIDLTSYKEQFTLDGNTGDYLNGIRIKGSGKLKVYDNNVLVYSGDVKDFVPPAFINSSHIYQLKSNQVFNVSYGVVYSSGTDLICNECPSKINTSLPQIGQDFHYFGLAQSGTVGVVGGSIALTNLVSNTIVTDYNNLPAGLYKAVATSGTPHISYTAGYSDISYNFYNIKGELVASIAPNGVQQLISNGISAYGSKEQIPFINFSTYDKQGRLTSLKTTDAGVMELIYRKDGKVRFSQNAEQRKNGRFSYTNYDDVGRAIESGEYLPGSISFESAKTNYALLENTDSEGGLGGGVKKDWTRIHYDSSDSSHGLTAYQQNFVENSVSWTENSVSKTWYSYDEQSRVTWLIKQINGLGVKTIDYTYDFLGNITKVAYQKDIAAESFYHHYEYDVDQRLLNVQTSTNGTNKKQQANYQYYLHGPLKRIEVGDNLQGIDYIYTAQGALKGVNHPDKNLDPGKDGIQNNFAADVFGMTLEYFNGDYVRNGTGINSLSTNTSKTFYDGNIVGQSWRSQKPNGIISAYGNAVNNPVMATYEFDNKYQFNSNKYGVPNFETGSFTEILNSNKEYNLSYDPNGNIKSMSRSNASGNAKNMAYNYEVNTNKLGSVDNHANYNYNDLGQMIGQTEHNGQGYFLNYDANGNIVAIYSDEARLQLKVSFAYDEAGIRIRKTDHLQNITTYYVVDAGGEPLAIYDNEGGVLLQKEIPVYADSRIGYYKRTGNNYQYEFSDNLGNVRVVINSNKLSNGQADVVYYSDYYPFGTPLTLQGGNDYRNGFQGQYADADKETGWNSFELRMYDPEIGRWMSVDPAGQYSSPYLSMGNNPVNKVDPDGGYDFWHGFAKWLASGFSGKFKRAESGDRKGQYYISKVVNDHSPGEVNIIRALDFGAGDHGGKFYPNGTIASYEPDLVDKWSDSDHWIAEMTYNTADGFYLGFGSLVPGSSQSHLNGRASISTERIGAFINSGTSIFPFGKAVQLIPKMNVIKFSSVISGTAISRLPQATRGTLLKVVNKVTNFAKITTIAKKGATTLKNNSSNDKKK